MIKKKLLTSIIVTVTCLFVFGIMRVSASAIDSGVCGDNLTWELDETGTLTISGTGNMEDFYNEITPWGDYKENIENVIIEDTVLSVGARAFKGCTNLQRITIGTNVEAIGGAAFRGCTSLRRIYWDAINVADFEVSNGVFYEAGINSSGIRVEFGDEVLHIPKYAFYPGFGEASYTPNIVKVNFGENTISIGYGAFSNCVNIQTIEIPDKVQSIGEHAFSSCVGIEKLVIGEGVKEIGGWAFYKCTAVEEVVWNAEAVVADQYSPFPWTFDSLGQEGNGIHVTFSESVKTIPNNLFCAANWDIEHYCNIIGVTIKNNVTEIGSYAFAKCPKLEEVTIEYGDEDLIIGYEAFSDCEKLSAITLLENFVGIQEEIFTGTSNLTIYGYNGSYAHEYAVKYEIPFVDLNDIKTPAEKLCDLINEQVEDSCEVDIETQTVTLLKNVELTSVVEIPVGDEIILDIKGFNVSGANESDALHIPTEASLKIIGTGIIRGGNTVDEQYNYVGSAVSNDGILRISGPTLVGGDEREMFCYAAPGVRGWGTTYFIEGSIQAGKGNYSDYVYYTKGSYTIVLESDDGENYTVVKQEWGSNKKYIKAVLVPRGLSAPEELAAVLNIIQPGTCSVASSKLTLNKDFSCPYSIEIPTGDAIILDFNGHTVTTDDFFMPFIIPEQAKITFKGNGLLTNKEQSSGTASGIGGGAAVISNEGKLTINGITVIGVGLCGISNDGELTVYSGKITVGDYASGKDAIVNSGNIEVFGGEIIGGNATRDGRSGGDGISSMSGVALGDGTYPIKLYGGILCGGKGFGDGENGRAISTSFNIGEACIAYESDDGENYFETDYTRSYMRYLKTVNINDNPEIEDGNVGDLGTPSVQNVINVHNVTFNGEKATFDLVLSGGGTITGNVYVAVYEGKRLSRIKLYTAETEMPVSIEYTNGQNIKIFWWNTVLAPMSILAEVKFE